MVINRKKIIFFLTFIFLLLIIIKIAGYFVYNSESFKSAKRFITSSKTLKKEFGSIESRDIRLSRSLEVGSDYAEYDILIDGSKQDGTAKIKLKKYRNEWKVVNATFETNDKKRFEIKTDNKVFPVKEKGISWVYESITGILTSTIGAVFIFYRERIANKLISLIPIKVRIILVVVFGVFELIIGFGFLFAVLRYFVG